MFIFPEAVKFGVVLDRFDGLRECAIDLLLGLAAGDLSPDVVGDLVERLIFDYVTGGVCRFDVRRRVGIVGGRSRGRLTRGSGVRRIALFRCRIGGRGLVGFGVGARRRAGR